MPASIMKNIKASICGWCKKPLGKPTMNQKGHSHKELMRCAYKSNTELYMTLQREEQLKKEIENMRGAMTQMAMKAQEKEEAEHEGLMQPEKENGSQEAKDLLEAENKKSTSS